MSVRANRKQQVVLRVGAPALTLSVLTPTAQSALSQPDDLDVLKVIPENYRLLIDNPLVRVRCATSAQRRVTQSELN